VGLCLDYLELTHDYPFSCPLGVNARGRGLRRVGIRKTVSPLQPPGTTPIPCKQTRPTLRSLTDQHYPVQPDTGTTAEDQSGDISKRRQPVACPAPNWLCSECRPAMLTCQQTTQGTPNAALPVATCHWASQGAPVRGDSLACGTPCPLLPLRPVLPGALVRCSAQALICDLRGIQGPHLLTWQTPHWSETHVHKTINTASLNLGHGIVRNSNRYALE
jgi:hypothetical protein